MGQDLSVNGSVRGVNTVVTAGGTTTLTNTSLPVQKFTGTASQTVVLPSALTLQNGAEFKFINQSTSPIIIEDSTAAILFSIPSETVQSIILNANTTAAGNWQSESGIKSITTITATASLASWSQVILVNASAGSVTLTLPQTSVATVGQRIDIKRIDSSNNTVSIVPFSGQTIDGLSSISMTQQYSVISLMSSTSLSYVVSKYLS